MQAYVDDLIGRYRRKGLLIDTNLLILLFVGLRDPQRIRTDKRTQKYVPEDHDTLVKILNIFEKVITTPNILTEVSNLLDADSFEDFAEGLGSFEEYYLSSADLAKTVEFRKFGMTDKGIRHLAADQYLVLTDDFRLSQYLQSNNVDTLNFNHIRTFNWR